MSKDTIYFNGKISTLDPALPQVSAMRISEGTISQVGSDRELLAKADDVEKVDLRGRRVIPGLNDSHLHVVRAGLFYNLELRWDGAPSVEQAMIQLKAQAERTPPPQWVRVIGGWNEFQFKEGRMPSLDEINRAAPETPVFLLHLYDCALLNRAALRVLGMDNATVNPPGGIICRDTSGQPTGLLIAEPSALILYSTIAKAPVLSFEDQLNSTRHFLRELNRFGLTSAADAGGGGQNYPDDYKVVKHLADTGDLTLRIAYSLFAQKPGAELQDYQRWIGMTKPGAGSDMLRVNGAGENLVWAAADFENFLQPRPELQPIMEKELEAVILELAKARWPWRIHATYDETISRFLNVFERVHREHPIDDLRWFVDHAETVKPKTLERIQALGGGIAIQHRMAFQGEYFVRRYGAEAVQATPPLKRILEMGIPLGAGTDGTRVASYHPWTCLWWLVVGRTVGGLEINRPENRLTREQALQLWTQGSAWFSGEESKKGTLSVNSFADFAVLSDDYFAVEEEKIRNIESVLTVTGGKVVYAAQEFAVLCPKLPKVSPSWSPVAHTGGYQNVSAAERCTHSNSAHSHTPIMAADGRVWQSGCGCGV